ncbi:exostosin family protein [uncultured Winogradskyella sp.]|uniref:exostosin domain-containing protein n=1 Tax=uncultured Winogradskyella sp. TaxID=395353 RepID=UPI00263906CC|nr:exostosin family protein [uncultured Winogradskyella sp.]
MKLYYPTTLYDSKSSNRYAVFPLLKVFLKSDKILENPAVEVFGFTNQLMTLVDDINEATVTILPMSWDFYVKENKEKIANDFIESVNSLNKLVFIFISGDFGVKIPDFPNVRVYRCSGYKSKLPNTHLGLPVFHRDPLERYYNSEVISLRAYAEIPTVGFCGQAIKSISNRIKEQLRIVFNNTRYYLGLAEKSPQKIQSTPYNRFKILDNLKGKSLIATNFIIRDQYGGGVKRGRGATKVAEEYFENMENSDYIICYRGAGNFSVRFYETLAMGRIPVYINTDGFLPLRESVNWKSHLVWVEPSEIHKIEEKIVTFHNALNQSEFEALQKSNRNLWKDQLNLWSFFYHQIQQAKGDN